MKRFLLLLLLAAACNDTKTPTRPDGTVTPPADAPDNLVEVAQLPVTVNRDVDVLVMIDDSPSTADKQNNLKQNFPAFINALSSLPGGLPNLHLGVVTSDLGTSATEDPTPGPSIGSGPGACTGHGKNGVLQTFGAPVTGNFVTDIKNPDGSRMTNYTGTLADAFSAMASAGSAGCGFEQPLEAIRLALDPATTANAGFLRPSAALAIIVLTDEDDCSASHTALFGTDTTTLGPLQSFRCTRFGVTCDQGGSTTDAMNQPGQKVACHDNTSGTYLTDVARYATYIKGLKSSPTSIVFGAIVGPPDPFAVELRTPPGGGSAIPALAHSCQYTDASNSTEVADPAVRIAELANQFTRAEVDTVCQQDLSAAEAAIAHQIGQLAGDTCLTRDIATPPTCQATIHSASGDTALASCGTSAADCFSIVADATACPAGQHFKVTLTWGTAPPPDGVVSVRCKP